jgi:hypothetical protein
LVIIWLKRCPARPLIELPLESAPVTVGVFDSGEASGTGVEDGFGKGELLGLGVGVGVLHSTPHSLSGVGDGDGDGDGDGEGEGDGEGDGEGEGEGDCAATDCAASSESASVIDTRRLRVKLAIVSARTACRWDRCRHRG